MLVGRYQSSVRAVRPLLDTHSERVADVRKFGAEHAHQLMVALASGRCPFDRFWKLVVGEIFEGAGGHRAHDHAGHTGD